MTEPEDLTLALIGDLADNDPWDVELWCRDDANANPGSVARWHRAGTCDPDRTQPGQQGRDRELADAIYVATLHRWRDGQVPVSFTSAPGRVSLLFDGDGKVLPWPTNPDPKGARR